MIIPTEKQVRYLLDKFTIGLDTNEDLEMLVAYIVDKHPEYSDEQIYDKLMELFVNGIFESLVNKDYLNVHFDDNISYSLTEKGKKHVETL